ncbi:MAG: Xaa-Pro peptidase family protein [candidate division WOR-3 bacterium]|nr:Xaa-Pro peptidase family protein [candidate division WOR-3 bacterium]
MKKDLDHLMKEKGISAIVGIGAPSRDGVMYYLLNGVNINGWYIKKYNGPAYVLHSEIEREEARKTGLKTMSFNKYNIHEIYNKYRDRIKANALFLSTVLKDLKIKGRIAFYGNMPMGDAYNFLRHLRRFHKSLEIAYESEKSLIMELRMTKDETEIERIKKVRNSVVRAFTRTTEWVRKMKIKDGVIYKEKNRKLTIGDLKKNISYELFKDGVVSSSGMIIAQARDAGVPHNAGKNNESVKLGKTIVFDIFPQEIGGGYYFDFTRTICFGYAPDHIKRDYELVRQAQDIAFENLEVGKRTRDVEIAVCKYFEKHNHPTFLSNPKTQIGYCHSLGHGLGLNVHESPSFGLFKTNRDKLEKGMVFTIEPGLYYPDKGYGIRLEDVIYIDKNGQIINLTKFPRELVIEV